MSAPQGETGLPRRGRRARGPAGSLLRQSGQGLLELLAATAILIILAAASIPIAASYLHESRLRGAAFHVRGLLRQVRARAAAEGRYIGVVFDEVDGDPLFSIYADGNANGIRRADIARGTEERLRDPYRLSETFPGVRYGQLPAGADQPYFPGLRIGRSKIVSFSPLGSSTSGTLFLSNDYGLVYAVVIMGATGKVRVARYRGGWWESM